MLKRILYLFSVMLMFGVNGADDFIKEAPKNPGVMGRTSNPGLPIRWELVGRPSGTIDATTLAEAGGCPDVAIGKYYFENISPGNYVLEISRKGFLVRYGVITVGELEPLYLGHREILGGDVNGDLMITEKDLSIIRTKIAGYSSFLYNPIYDLRGLRGVSKNDIDIIEMNLGAYANIYQETEDWIDPNP